MDEVNNMGKFYIYYNIKSYLTYHNFDTSHIYEI